MREFKVGDWIIYTGDSDRWLNTPLRIIKIDKNGWIYHKPNSFSGGGFRKPNIKKIIIDEKYCGIPARYRPQPLSNGENN